MSRQDIVALKEINKLSKIHLDAINKNLNEILSVDKSYNTLINDCTTDLFTLTNYYTNSEDTLRILKKNYINILKCIILIEEQNS